MSKVFRPAGRIFMQPPDFVNGAVELLVIKLRQLQLSTAGFSDQSIHLRFFGSLKELSERKAKYFSHADAINRFALVALEPEDIIAVARFDREEAGSDKAEYALIVADGWQEYGLGLSLTHQLLDVARDKGISCLYGLVLSENQRMLRLLRSLDFPKYEHREGDIKYIELELAA